MCATPSLTSPSPIPHSIEEKQKQRQPTAAAAGGQTKYVLYMYPFSPSSYFHSLFIFEHKQNKKRVGFKRICGFSAIHPEILSTHSWFTGGGE
jgi:hypothetical protein